MSGSDTTDTTEKALQRVRDTFESAAEDADQMSDTARQGVQDAINTLEERINQLRGNG